MILWKLNEYLPLKQGLRRWTLQFYPQMLLLNEYLPLKQGLRHVVTVYRLAVSTQWVSSIKTRIKTELVLGYTGGQIALNEYLPLKQGLRLWFPERATKLAVTQWVSSIKTRIKTLSEKLFVICIISQWVSSIKTRIKTNDVHILRHVYFSMSIFH